MQFPSRTVSVWIDRDPATVYAFAADPMNLPRWASGLAAGIAKVDGEWVAETPGGTMALRFTEPNPFGILDHHVIPPQGEPIYSPMRVIPNGTGSEVAFTLFRLPTMTDETFEADARWVEKDLQSLKRLLEG